MSLRQHSCLLIFAVLLSCTKAAPKQSSLKELHKSFVEALKSGDQKLLSEYCLKLQPSDEIQQYMEDNHFSYRGIPDDWKKNNISTSQSGESYCNSLIEFQQMLNKNGNLKKIEMGELTLNDSIIINRRLDIASTEVQFRLSTKNQIFNCTLGELLKIQGNWYAFNYPIFN